MIFSNEALDFLATTASVNRRSSLDDQFSDYRSIMMNKCNETTSVTSSIGNDVTVKATSDEHKIDPNYVGIGHHVVDGNSSNDMFRTAHHVGVGGESRHREDLLKDDDFMTSVVTPSPRAKSDRSDEVLKNSNMELFHKLDYSEKVHFNRVPVSGYNMMTCLQDTEEFVDCTSLEVPVINPVKLNGHYYSAKMFTKMVDKSPTNIHIKCPHTRQKCPVAMAEYIKVSKKSDRTTMAMLKEAKLFRYLKKERVENLDTSLLHPGYSLERLTAIVPSDFFYKR